MESNKRSNKKIKKKGKKKVFIILAILIILIAIIGSISIYFVTRSRGVIPIGEVKPTSTFASNINKSLFELEKNEVNNTNLINEAILARGGSALNTCVLFQSNALRAVGINVPENITFTTNLAQYLESNGWVKETDFQNLQSGDLCFAGNTHTFLFMGWENKSKDLAYVMGDESYMFPNNYMIRNLNGQYPSSSNGNNAQYQTTYYLKYQGNATAKALPSNAKENALIKNSLGKVAVKSPSGLWMTSGISNSSEKLVCLDPNIILYVIKSENGSYEVYYNGQVGWVQAAYTTGLGNPIANNSENVENQDATSTTNSKS
ncbi:MAG: hypothetical protein ACRDD2_06990 [Sarcina sp.]